MRITTEVDVEIDIDTIVADMDADEKADLRKALDEDEASVDVAKLVEQVFYHFTGKNPPPCLRDLVFALSGRVL